MYYYLKGKISIINDDSVIIDVHDVGYLVLMSHPDIYKINDIVTIYTYFVIKEDEQYLIGFPTINEKRTFTSLISVKGIGPKTALNAMRATTSEELLKAISANNITFLKRLPGIGAKAASQIILDLKGQLTGTDSTNPTQYDEVRDALKSLGFKTKAVDDVLAEINEVDSSNEDILRIALKKLKK